MKLSLILPPISLAAPLLATLMAEHVHAPTDVIKRGAGLSAERTSTSSSSSDEHAISDVSKDLGGQLRRPDGSMVLPGLKFPEKLDHITLPRQVLWKVQELITFNHLIHLEVPEVGRDYETEVLHRKCLYAPSAIPRAWLSEDPNLSKVSKGRILVMVYPLIEHFWEVAAFNPGVVGEDPSAKEELRRDLIVFHEVRIALRKLVTEPLYKRERKMFKELGLLVAEGETSGSQSGSFPYLIINVGKAKSYSELVGVGRTAQGLWEDRGKCIYYHKSIYKAIVKKMGDMARKGLLAIPAEESLHPKGFLYIETELKEGTLVVKDAIPLDWVILKVPPGGPGGAEYLTKEWLKIAYRSPESLCSRG